MKVYISIFVIVLLCLGGMSWADEEGVGGSGSFDADDHSRIAQLEDRVQYLENRLATAIEIIDYISFQENPINSLSGPHIIFSGVNVHIRNGSGNSVDDINGLGNLIVGYNECSYNTTPTEFCEYVSRERTGSHILVVGDRHEYTSINGFVAGRENTITGEHASVTAGLRNIASGNLSTVSGGGYNKATSLMTSVSGGEENIASYYHASVSGGMHNEASGYNAHISGGWLNKATAYYASVNGGFRNSASGQSASVSGGKDRDATGTYNWVAGGLWEDD